MTAACAITHSGEDLLMQLLK